MKEIPEIHMSKFRDNDIQSQLQLKVILLVWHDVT